jgi:hypothetical protein
MPATVIISPLATPLKTTLLKIAALEATALDDITGTSGSIRSIEIENTSGADVYVKAYNATPITLGAIPSTTDPDWQFKCDASSSQTYVMDDGASFSTALSMACSTEKGTPTTTDPAADVNVNIVISAS